MRGDRLLFLAEHGKVATPMEISEGVWEGSKRQAGTDKRLLLRFFASLERRFNRNLGNGVQKNGRPQLCPYRRCGVGNEIVRMGFPFGENSAAFCKPVCSFRGYRVRIVDGGVDLPRPLFAPPPFRIPHIQKNPRASPGGIGRVVQELCWNRKLYAQPDSRRPLLAKKATSKAEIARTITIKQGFRGFAKGSRKRCLPVFSWKWSWKKRRENGRKRQKTEKNGSDTVPATPFAKSRGFSRNFMQAQDPQPQLEKYSPSVKIIRSKPRILGVFTMVGKPRCTRFCKPILRRKIPPRKIEVNNKIHCLEIRPYFLKIRYD